MSVWDTKCDDHASYIELQVSYSVGPTPHIKSALKTKNGSCNGSNNIVENFASYRAPSGGRISHVEVYICQSDGGFDTCYHEGWIKNPYF